MNCDLRAAVPVGGVAQGRMRFPTREYVFLQTGPPTTWGGTAEPDASTPLQRGFAIQQLGIAIPLHGSRVARLSNTPARRNRRHDPS